MADKIISNPYECLRVCKDAGEIDDILTEIGFPCDSTNKRLLYLYDYMGVKQIFCSHDDIDVEREYVIVKQEFASRVWEDLK